MNTEQFQQWLANREEILRKLAQEVDEPTRQALDFTPESLRAVGDYLVRRFPSLPDLHRPESRSQHLGLSTYAYEVFRRNLNLEPRLPQDDPRYQYFGVPVLHRPGGPDVAPFDLVTFTVHRRNPGLLAEVFANQRRQTSGSQQSNGPSPVQPAAHAMSDEDFTSWLTFLTDRLDGFLDTLDQSIRQRFDFSPDSLRFVGDAIVSGTLGQDAADPQSGLFADLYSYVADVFHRNLGLQFLLPKDPKDAAYGQPSIRDPSGATISLPQLVIETARRRDPKLLYDTFVRVRDGWIRPGRGAR
jgi:hypothetical protein